MEGCPPVDREVRPRWRAGKSHTKCEVGWQDSDVSIFSFLPFLAFLRIVRLKSDIQVDEIDKQGPYMHEL